MVKRAVIPAGPAAEVRRYREALHWTQAEAASFLDYSPNHFAGFEQAREPVPLVVLRALHLEVLKRARGE